MSILIRPIEEADLPSVEDVFIRSIRLGTGKEYSPAQQSAWIGRHDLAWWRDSFLDKKTAVAFIDGRIVGFGDAKGSYIDRLYVDPDYFRLGVGKALLSYLEQGEQYPLEVYASKTALLFFVSQGYVVEKENIVVRLGINLSNYFMRKYRN